MNYILAILYALGIIVVIGITLTLTIFILALVIQEIYYGIRNYIYRRR